METLSFEDYSLEIFSDFDYSLKSVDNLNKYSYQYISCEDIDKHYDSTISKYGIQIKKDDEIIDSVIIFSSGGGKTSPHKRSAIVDERNLIIAIGDSLFSLSLPRLMLNWKVKKTSCCVCFELFQVKSGYIIHGELSIFKVSKSGQIDWEVYGKDIFTTIDGVDDFKIIDDTIIARDWENNIYKFNLNGNIIS